MQPLASRHNLKVYKTQTLDKSVDFQALGIYSISENSELHGIVN